VSKPRRKLNILQAREGRGRSKLYSHEVLDGSVGVVEAGTERTKNFLAREAHLHDVAHHGLKVGAGHESRCGLGFNRTAGLRSGGGGGGGGSRCGGSGSGSLSRLRGGGLGGLGGRGGGSSCGRGILGLPHHQDEEIGGLNVESVKLGIVGEDLASEDKLLPRDVLTAHFLDLLLHIENLCIKRSC
jgi:hypothetical protein